MTTPDPVHPAAGGTAGQPVGPGPVVITGGAGFIGQRVARRLTQQGRTVVAFDLLRPQVHRDPQRAVHSFPGEVIVGDVRDVPALEAALAEASAVVHLAAETGVGQSMYEVDRYTSVNVDGTRNVLAAAAAAGNLPVVVASSRAVYGAGAFECSAHGRQIGMACCDLAAPAASLESDAFAPVSVYGRTKVDAEQLAGEFAGRGGRVVAIRPQNVIGAGQALHNPYTGVLAAFAARLRQGLPPQVYGTGSQTRDFIAVDDVAAVIAALLADPARWPEHPVLNVGSGVRITLRELALASCRAARAPERLEFVDITRPGDIDHACADLTLSTAAGMPAATVDFATSVQAFLDFAASEDPVDPAIWDTALDELSDVARD